MDRESPASDIGVGMLPKAREGGGVDTVRTEGLKVLHAARLGPPSTVKEALEKDPEGALSLIDDYGHTLLHQAAMGDQIETIMNLLDAGMTVDVLTDKHQTPLHVACFCGSLRAISLLLKEGASVDMVDRNKRFTPLMMTVLSGKARAVALILEWESFHGHTQTLNVNMGDECGNTALHWACSKGLLRTAELLLRHSASFTTNNFGCSPLHWAAFQGHTEVVKLLLKRFAGQIGLLDSQGMTAYQISLQNGHKETARAIAKPNSISQLVKDFLTRPRNYSFFAAFMLVGFYLSLGTYMPWWTLLLIGVLSARIYGGLRTLSEEDRVRKKWESFQWTDTYICGYFYGLLVWGSIWFFQAVFPHSQQETSYHLLALLCVISLIALHASLWFGDSGTIPNELDNIESIELYMKSPEEIPADHDKSKICFQCETVKRIRSRHCHTCNRCVARHDQHLKWVGTCIGQGNHLKYLILQVVLSFTLFFFQIFSFAVLWNANEKVVLLSFGEVVFYILNNYPSLGLLLLLSAICFIGVTVQLVSHAQCISKNVLTHERKNWTGIPYLNSGGSFQNPFDRGFVANWQELIGIGYDWDYMLLDEIPKSLEHNVEPQV